MIPKFWIFARIKVRLAIEFYEYAHASFNADFENNKQVLKELAKSPSKHLRNRVAGYIVRIVKKKLNAGEVVTAEHAAADQAKEEKITGAIKEKVEEQVDSEKESTTETRADRIVDKILQEAKISETEEPEETASIEEPEETTSIEESEETASMEEPKEKILEKEPDKNTTE